MPGVKSRDLIVRIYESVGDQAALEEIIGQITLALDSRGAHFGVIDPHRRWHRSLVVGAEERIQTEYLEYYAAEDPRLPYCLAHPGVAVPDHVSVSDVAGYERTSLVNELLDKNEARFSANTIFPVGSGFLGALAFFKPRRRGPYNEWEIRSLDSLLPHIQRSLELHIRIGRLESQVASLEELVDRLATPILLVDRTGVPCYEIAAGREALRRGDFLTIRNGHIEPRSLKQVRQFLSLLSSVCCENFDASSGRLSNAIRLFSLDDSSATLRMYPMRGLPRLSAMRQADVLLFLTYADPTSATNELRLQTLFRLTPAEARLASYLIRGESLAEISQRFHLSRATLKTQLSSLFDKTGARRQGELVALLLSSVTVPIA